MDKRPKVGVGVIVIKDNKVLCGLRKSTLGFGVWGFPGGKLEYGEDVIACAKRETLEEANVQLKHIRLAPFTNDIFEDEHYVTLFVVGEYARGRVTVMEPTKCERWEWFAWDKLPRPLFLPIINLQKQQFNPFQNA